MGKKAIFIIGAILLIDQIIKICVKTYMVPEMDGAISIVDGFMQLYYVENIGMAFGSTLGEGIWAKYALSIFRISAIIGIGWYLRKLIRERKSSKGLIVAISLVLAGAAGNLIDSLCYDLIWDLDPNIAWNYTINSSGGYVVDPATGFPQLRAHGFLLGSVVDMFQFTTVWPSWTPNFQLNLPQFLGGSNLIDLHPGKMIFGYIWNFADLSVLVGGGLFILKYRKVFKKTNPENTSNSIETNVETAN